MKKCRRRRQGRHLPERWPRPRWPARRCLPDQIPQVRSQHRRQHREPAGAIGDGQAAAPLER